MTDDGDTFLLDETPRKFELFHFENLLDLLRLLPKILIRLLVLILQHLFIDLSLVIKGLFDAFLKDFAQMLVFQVQIYLNLVFDFLYHIYDHLVLLYVLLLQQLLRQLPICLQLQVLFLAQGLHHIIVVEILLLVIRGQLQLIDELQGELLDRCFFVAVAERLL